MVYDFSGDKIAKYLNNKLVKGIFSIKLSKVIKDLDLRKDDIYNT